MVSGNASPRVTSTHNGLGSYSPKRMANLTDSDLVGFLLASAVDVNDLSRLKKGQESVQFLLDNWSRETVDPNSGEDSPDRDHGAYRGMSWLHPLPHRCGGGNSE